VPWRNYWPPTLLGKLLASVAWIFTNHKLLGSYVVFDTFHALHFPCVTAYKSGISHELLSCARLGSQDKGVRVWQLVNVSSLHPCSWVRVVASR
jgi:hypothetical protein